MKTNNKVGWQKYEDLLQSQLESPLLDMLHKQAGEVEDFEEEDVPYQDEQDRKEGQMLIPINERLMENISIASNFLVGVSHPTVKI